MSHEQPQSKSEGYELFEEWSGVGEIAEIVGEIMILPVEIPFEVLGDIATEAIDGFSGGEDHD